MSKTTSPGVARLAARVLAGLEPTRVEARMLAASALAQVEDAELVDAPVYSPDFADDHATTLRAAIEDTQRLLVDVRTWPDSANKGRVLDNLNRLIQRYADAAKQIERVREAIAAVAALMPAREA